MINEAEIGLSQEPKEAVLVAEEVMVVRWVGGAALVLVLAEWEAMCLFVYLSSFVVRYGMSDMVMSDESEE